MRIRLCHSIGYKAISILSAIALALGSLLIVNVPKAFACYTWAVGQRVGLKGGTQIRTGSGFAYPVHTTLPPSGDNWPVDIIDGPRSADGQEWWDISRQNIDGGGTGWVYKAQAGYDVCPPVTPGNVYVASGLELQPEPQLAAVRRRQTDWSFHLREQWRAECASGWVWRSPAAE